MPPQTKSIVKNFCIPNPTCLFRNDLLEDLSVGPVVGLATNGDGLLPSPGVIDELAVLGLGVVELGEAVRLPIRGDVEGRLEFLAADDESAGDDGVVGLAVDAL